MTVEQHGPLPLTNFMPGRYDPVDGSPIAIDSIVLHTMVGWISGADARFHNGAAQVSAHFGVRIDGSLWQWVQVWDTAYHAGLFYENLRSIGIEHEDGGDYAGVRPEALYGRSVALVAQLCREYQIPCVRGTGGPGIYDHRDILNAFGAGSATACPDALDTHRIIREAAALIAGAVIVPAPAPPTDATVLRTPAPIDAAAAEWAALYALEAPKAGIRPELALAQALHETAAFTYPGIAKPYWNNPAGLGVTGAPDMGNHFATKYDGVVAHLQHLLMYFTPAHTPYCSSPNVIDQRHFAHRGYPDDVHQLDGHWAMPGTGYGDAILHKVLAARALLGST